MDWFSILFVALAVVAAAFSAHVAWRARRDAANWAIDPDSKQLQFQNWTELSFALVILLLSASVIVLAVAL